MALKELLGVVPTLQSVALVEDSYALVRKKKKTARDFLSTGTRAIVGTALIKAESDMIGGM